MRRLLGKILSTARAKEFTFAFKKRGKGNVVHGKPYVVTPENIEIGNNCTINHGVFLSGMGGIIIGDNVRLSNYCQIQTGSLDLNHHYINRPHIYNPIIIQDGVWVCAGAIITGGVILGEGCVVAANSVVTKDVPPFTLVAGAPAKIIRELTNEN